MKGESYTLENQIKVNISDKIEACSKLENSCRQVGFVRLADFVFGRIEGMKKAQNIMSNCFQLSNVR